MLFVSYVLFCYGMYDEGFDGVGVILIMLGIV